MNTFEGNLKITGGTIKTWQELLTNAIRARTYSADGPTNTKLQNEAIGRFRGGFAFIRRMLPNLNIASIDAYKGNQNGVLDQTKWTLPGDINLQPGGGNHFDGGIEYRRNWKIAIASVGIYAAADTVIEVELEVE
jgi:hypothetical protein